MPIYKGNTQIVGLYKGSTEIVKRYKGSDLIYEAFTWLPYSFEYLYYSLIPTTIDNKSVKDKLRLNKIYANGVIENQQNRYGDFPYDSVFKVSEPDYMQSVVSNNKMTCSLLQNISSGTGTYMRNGNYIQNHKYFVTANIKSITGNNTVGLGFSTGSGQFINTTVNAGATAKAMGFITPSSNVTNCIIRFDGAHSAGNSFEISEYEIIDLTLMFGTGNEPTTLTDNRIQALLNRGYIEYNAGTYRSTDIGEFVSEPYNLFDGELEGRGIRNDNGLNNNDDANFRTKNYIPVKQGQNYTFEYNRSGLEGTIYMYIHQYDSDKNFISTISYITRDTYQLTLDNNTCYVRVHWYKPNADWHTNPPTEQLAQFCLHLTGTRTGYAPHTEPQTLSFKYQGNGAINSHDTLEITNTEWVFTKNIGSIDLGSLSWSYPDTSFNAKLTHNNNGGVGNVSNMCCDKYITRMNGSSYNVDKALFSANDSYIRIRDDSYNGDYSAFATAMSGVILHYQLQTPQVIRIPRKHLAVVDLGSLTNWGKNVAYSHNETVNTGIQSLIKKVSGDTEKANMYCVKYTTNSRNAISNMQISINALGTIIINDSELYPLTSEQIQAKLSGVYLFYETQDEVADIQFEIGVEAGGTLSPVWFEWVCNQLVSNGNYANGTTNWVSLRTTLSASGGVLTVTCNSNSSTAWGFSHSNMQVVSSHKYLITFDFYHNISLTKVNKFDVTLNYDRTFTAQPNVWNKIALIVTSTTSGNYGCQTVVRFNDTSDIQVGTDYLMAKNYQTLDLTLAFGSGNEPTDVSDPRVQAILNKGYIAYNATGTTTYETSEVLPNLDALVKCK